MADATAGVTGSGGTPITDHEPYPQTDETTPSRVYVNDNVRIPVGDVDIFMRREGPLDVTRYVEAEFPSPWDGTQWVDVFETPRPDEQSSPDTVRVDVRDHVTGRFYPAFVGVVTGVGSSASGGSKWYQFRAEGPGHRLSDIPADTSFAGVYPDAVLGYITERLDEKLPLNISLGEVSLPDQQNADGEEDSDDVEDDPAAGYPGEYDPSGNEDAQRDYSRSFEYPTVTKESFQFGRDTLADVASWIARKAGVFLWLEPTEDGATLLARRNPPMAHHQAHHLGGDVKVINNDALSELRPVNCLILKAPAKESVKDTNTYNVGERGEEIVVVKARHETLYERAGGTELHAGPERVSDAMTKTEAENEAQRRLKNQIDETTAGDMETLLRSPITPYDTITAKPTCDQTPAENTDSLTYEVSRVTHRITGEGMPHTQLNVGLHTSVEDDINIISGWQTEAGFDV